MHHTSSYRQDYERLEQELESDEYGRLLTQLQEVSPFLRQFRAWAEVVAFMRAGTSEDPRKDEVLRPMLTAHEQSRDHRWRTVLLVIFWPGLRSICRQKAHWDPHHDERWQRVVWIFLEAVCQLDLRRRSDRLVQKLINDVIHRLHREYRSDWKEKELASPMAPDLLTALAGGAEDSGFALIEARDDREARIAHLSALLEEDLITEADFLLLVGTRVYGQPLADYVREHGLSYEATKKRRQRAEAAIRRHEKKQRK